MEDGSKQGLELPPPVSRPKPGTGGGELDGLRFRLIGRLDRYPRARVRREIERRGGAVLGPRGTADYVVIGHGAVDVVRSGQLAGLLKEAGERRVDRRTGWVIGEAALLRLIGLLPPMPPETRSIEEAELLRLSGLDRTTLEALEVFELVHREDDRFGFRDLRAARRAQELRRAGVALHEILRAAVELRRSHEDFAHPDLVAAADGQLLVRAGERFAELGGQLRLGLPDAPDLDALFAEAEAAEDAGELDRAERLYRRCLNASPVDPVAHFSLANVLALIGETASARVLYQRTVRLEPSFAEAWYNLAQLEAKAGRDAVAEAALLNAVAVAPDWPEPAYRLAGRLVERERYGEALPLLERYLRLDGDSACAATARRMLALCRIALHQQATSRQREASSEPEP